MVKIVYRFIYISLLKCWGPERMGHNTCRCIGRVLRVVRRFKAGFSVYILATLMVQALKLHEAVSICLPQAYNSN